ncbi:hypothetical protein [Roseicella sp. DB1501]|nr:hypothetical protein [Roseicella sp. DB1501]
MAKRGRWQAVKVTGVKRGPDKLRLPKLRKHSRKARRKAERRR